MWNAQSLLTLRNERIYNGTVIILEVSGNVLSTTLLFFKMFLNVQAHCFFLSHYFKKSKESGSWDISPYFWVGFNACTEALNISRLRPTEVWKCKCQFLLDEIRTSLTCRLSNKKSAWFQLCLNTTVFCEFCTDSTFTQAKHKSEMDYLCVTQQSRPVNNLT